MNYINYRKCIFIPGAYLFFLASICVCRVGAQNADKVVNTQVEFIDTTAVDSQYSIVYFANIADCQRCLVDISNVTECLRSTVDSTLKIKVYVYLRVDRDKEFMLHKHKYEAVSTVKKDEGLAKSDLGLQPDIRMAIFKGKGRLLCSLSTDEYNKSDCNYFESLIKK